MKYTELLKKQIGKNEPYLSDMEKKEMWQSILLKTQRKRLHISFRWVAAILVLLAVGELSYHLWDKSNSYEALMKNVSIASLGNIHIYIGKQKLELPDNSEIHCQKLQQIEIKQGEFQFSLSNFEEKSPILLVVPAQKKAKVMLSDGSLITLNENSKLLFSPAFSHQTRHVQLEGEAYMEVAQDKLHPFTVSASTMDVRVLGTEFLISAYPERNEHHVTLINGLVEIASAEGVKVELHPEECYIYKVSNKYAKVCKAENIEEQIAWKKDYLIVEKKTLTFLLQQAEKYYHTEFTYDMTRLSQIHLSGKFDVSIPVNEFLSRLTRIAPISVEKHEEVFIISSTNPNP